MGFDAGSGDLHSDGFCDRHCHALDRHHRRIGGGVYAAAGTVALAAVAHAPNLPALIAAQLAAGAAWGLIIGYAFTAALDTGRTGREGRFTGLVFALLALAALTRFGFVVSGLNQSPGIGPLLGALPAVAWAGALVLLVLAARGGAFSR